MKGSLKMIEFFLPMKKIPTVTHQQKKVTVVKNKQGKSVPRYYEPPELKEARNFFMGLLGPHAPNQPINQAVRFISKWCFPSNGKHPDGSYKITKPDVDNSNKLLQDCMTDLGFWKDDCLVSSLIAEKFWADVPGIYIRIEEL